MATTAQIEGFNKALAEGIALTIDELNAPLGLIHNVTVLPAGSKSLSVPTGTGLGAMAAATDGGSGGAENSIAIVSETTITPAPYYIRTNVAKVNLQNPEYFGYLVNQFSSAAHQRIMATLIGDYDGLTGGGAGATGMLDAVDFSNDEATIRGNGFTGPYVAVVHPICLGQVRADLAANYQQTLMTSEMLQGVPVRRLFDTYIFEDSNIDIPAGSYYRNFIGTRDCIRIAIRGADLDGELRPMVDVSVTELGDSVNVAVAASIWYATAVIAPNAGLWLKATATD